MEVEKARKEDGGKECGKRTSNFTWGGGEKASQ